METKKLSLPELPPVLPHGWKKEVALTLGIHPNTISRGALRSGKGIHLHENNKNSGCEIWRKSSYRK